MSIDRNGHPEGDPLASIIGKAAAAIATAVTESMGRTLAASGQRVADDAFRAVGRGKLRDPAVQGIEQAFAQYRDALGDLAAALPQVAQRASLLLQAEPGMRLLFRARPVAGRPKPRGARSRPHEIEVEDALCAAIAALKDNPRYCKAWLSAGTLDGLATASARIGITLTTNTGRARLQLLLTQVAAQFGDERRRDLPRHIDDVKHEIRANPEDGLRLARATLGWMLEDHLADAYGLLDALDGVLGPTCLRNILHERALFDAFKDKAVAGIPAAPVDKSWSKPLQTCFAGIGHMLGEALTVLASGPAKGREFVLLDHDNDRVFQIRAVGKEFEVYGVADGRSYARAYEPAVPEAAPAPASDRVREHLTVTMQPRILPHRVHDASCGMAVWAVDRRPVQEHLDSLGLDYGFRAWDMGVNRTPLALFAVHYRETDLGEYFELGLGCFVAPRRDPLAVGMFVMGRELPVSTLLSQQVGVDIWGYPKTYVPRKHWDVTYRPDEVLWRLTLETGETINVRLPRGGARSSARIPLLSYTEKFGLWHRSVLTRNGSGENVRVGGHGVEVTVEGAGKSDWRGGVGTSQGLLGLLDQYGLWSNAAGKRGLRSAYSTWTEHMHGELGPPSVVVVPPLIEEA